METAAGLGAIGSAKTGSMLEFDDYYQPLADGKPLALAFRDWFCVRAADSMEVWERSWFYGMALIGDGLLRPAAVHRDAAVEAFLRPTSRETLELNVPVIPQARVANNGEMAADFDVRLTIGADYSDTIRVSLQPGATDTVTFSEWNAHPEGLVVLTCSTMLANDQRDWNDRLALQVIVEPPPGINHDGSLPFKPTDLRLLQSPTRKTFRLQVDVNRSGPLRIQLADRAGRVVETVFSGRLAAGTHRLSVDAAGLSPGVYFLLLNAGDVQSRQAVAVIR